MNPANDNLTYIDEYLNCIALDYMVQQACEELLPTGVKNEYTF